METDRLGRRRRPDQERGLRPLFPLLPEEWQSRALRVAMSADDWARFDALVAQAAPEVPTQARAYGLTVARLMHQADQNNASPGPLDWMDWERRKALRLLRTAN